MVMPANNTGALVKQLHSEFPHKVGLLISPGGWRMPPNGMNYAIDNGAFTGFDEIKFFKLLEKTRSTYQPLWVAVPDVVSDAEATNILWHQWKNRIDYRKAFVVQDGHEPQDVPKEAYAVFVGGSTEWN